MAVGRSSTPSTSLRARLDARGPDSSETVTFRQPAKAAQELRQDCQSTEITLYSTVLSLRGTITVPQPLQDAEGHSVLCWNGEAWSVDGVSTTGNDTGAILTLLKRAAHGSATEQDLGRCASTVSRALSTVAGPYAFTFFDRQNGRLYFGRDFLGRRSLLYSISRSGGLTISSVPCSETEGIQGWKEIEADGIYCVSTDAVEVIEPHDLSVFVPYAGRFAAGHASYTHMQSPGHVDHNSVGVSQRYRK